MINSQFKLRVERKVQEIHAIIRERILTDMTYIDVLKKTQSCYVNLDAGADWNCTFGLMDPLYEEYNQLYDGVNECIIEIILRHKTDTGLFTDIVSKVNDANGQRTIDQYPNALVCNMATHVEYEALMVALGKVMDLVKTTDFTNATSIFKKRAPTP